MNIRLLVPVMLLLVIACQNGGTKNEQSEKVKATVITQEDSLVSAKISIDTVNNEFTSYWKTFRAAVISWDTTEIMKLTKFPFATRGQSDEDPSIDHPRKQFIRIFKAFLQQWDGEKVNGGTELEGIRKTESINSRYVQDDLADVGNNMSFYKEDNEWKLAKIYLNKKTINQLKK